MGMQPQKFTIFPVRRDFSAAIRLFRWLLSRRGHSAAARNKDELAAKERQGSQRGQPQPNTFFEHEETEATE